MVVLQRLSLTTSKLPFTVILFANALTLSYGIAFIIRHKD